VGKRFYLPTITMPHQLIACSFQGVFLCVQESHLHTLRLLIKLRIEAKEAGNMTCNDAAITLKDLPYTV